MKDFLAIYLGILLFTLQSVGYSCPPVMLLREILSEKDRITFFGFLTSLSKSAKLNEMIGMK